MKSHCVTIRTPRVRNINIHIDINIYQFLQCMSNVRHYIVCVWLRSVRNITGLYVSYIR